MLCTKRRMSTPSSLVVATLRPVKVGRVQLGGEHGEKKMTRPRTTIMMRYRFPEGYQRIPMLTFLRSDWWFASTAIPLIAATFAPMANVLSIAALVVFWRNKVIDNDPATYMETSIGYPDPKW